MNLVTKSRTSWNKDKFVRRAGTVSGNLVTLSEYERRGGKGIIYWKCQCSCGNFVWVRGDRIGDGRQRSCGCISRSKCGTNAIGQVWRWYRKNAKNRGLAFELSLPAFLEMIVRPCVYCGVSLTSTNRSKWTGGDFQYTGIDRLDSSKGYVIGNVAPCCVMCNWMKRESSCEDFRHRIIAVYNHWASQFGM